MLSGDWRVARLLKTVFRKNCKLQLTTKTSSSNLPDPPTRKAGSKSTDKSAVADLNVPLLVYRLLSSGVRLNRSK